MVGVSLAATVEVNWVSVNAVAASDAPTEKMWALGDRPLPFYLGECVDDVFERIGDDLREGGVIPMSLQKGSGCELMGYGDR